MATSDIISTSGIILRLSPSKEHDGMILALSKDGFLSFYAHGIGKLTSKYAASLQPLTLSSFTLRKSSSGSLSLKEASIISSFYGKDHDLPEMGVASILIELSTHFVQEDEAKDIYPYLERTISVLNEGKDPYCAGLIFFARVLIAMGIGLNVDECVSCGNKKGITAISFAEGGLLCHDCATSLGVESRALEALKVYRYIFKAPLEDIGRVRLDSSLAKALFRELAVYLEQLTGAKLKSVDFLEQI